jgi:benzoyl-CoA-dihydrodiol lyase
MVADSNTAPPKLELQTHPDHYKHWKLSVNGAVAHLSMNVQQDEAVNDEEYILKLNSYDLGVDIELADATQRIRFEHPEVRCLVIDSAIDRVFCSGANIYMLGTSTHSFKVNFCKYTNETRLYLEDLTENSGVGTIAALNGTASGGGYELALACEHIMLIDDGNSAVSFPETPLLAVLPGTGGLTRLVDKRMIRRDRADVFSTIAEGIKGKRAVKWDLVDELVARSKWEEKITARAEIMVNERPEKVGAGIEWTALGGQYEDDAITHKFVSLKMDRKLRVADITVKAPNTPQPEDGEGFRKAGTKAWALQAFRELDDVLLRLRFEEPHIGLINLKTEGDIDKVLAADRGLLAAQDDWLAREILHHMKRVIKRLDLMAKSMFSYVAPGSCFGGSLLELALASDRIFMLDDPDHPVHVATSKLNAGVLPMGNGLSRLQARFLANPGQVDAVLEEDGLIDTETADDLGLVTFAPDDIDWDDEIRIAVEERVNFSPDALTGMEANLRFAGPETMETKIFGRLSAWQNWIFQRPNAVGPKGALTLYGKQTRPEYNMNRT